MESQKTTTIGVALIMLIAVVWFFYNQPKPVPQPQKPVAADTASIDSSRSVASAVDTAKKQTAIATQSSQPDTSLVIKAAPEVTATVNSPLFTARISSKGASISSFVLKQFVTYQKTPLDLVNHADYHGGDVNLKFVSSDGKTISTNELPFTLDSSSVTLKTNDSTDITAIYRLDSARTIQKIFHFNGSQYLIGIEFKLNGMQNTVGGYHYTVALDNPIPFVERSTADELSNSRTFAGVAGDIEDVKVNKKDEVTHKPVGGDISYIGIRNQYFVQALIPVGEKANGAELNGKTTPAPDGEVISKYSAEMNVPIKRLSSEVLSFNMYFGPLEYQRVTALGVGLESAMDFGWHFVVRPISLSIMLPFFLWLHGFFSNWGVVIIVFSIFIKLITIPISTGQMRSMRKMQVLQPKVTELRAKYKEDSKKMNEELMKLYKTYGANPAGGCLPSLLQMPILYALYAVLRNVIQLRQAPFAFWIHDLSLPDALVHFGSKLPLLGDHLSGLTLLLVITMFLQQMLTVTDPRQKQMAYIMPIVFTFIFNNLPSGVGLYYLMFNLFGIIQQFYLMKIATPLSLEEMKADPKKSKGGGMMARLQAMEESQRNVRKEQYAGKGKKK